MGVGISILTSCDPFAEEISADPSLQFTYSVDTLKFDTIITSVSSINRGFRIFNPNDKAIEISELYLGKRASSEYKLIVQGREGHSFEDLVVFGKDSLLVLAEVLIDPMDEDLPYLVKDSIVIDYNTNLDHIKLVSWGQDANFIDSEIIACDVTWNSQKPYVIYNRALIDTSCTLTVAEGVKIYLDNNAELLVAGSLDIQGTAENKVLIRNSRLDPGYDKAPGQWFRIYFLPGSTGNFIHHAEIINGVSGLTLGLDSEGNNTELTITNTSIGHMSFAGIFALNANLNATNLEIYNCAEQMLAVVAGGNYTFDHCTFSNEPSDFIRQNPSVIFSDLYDNGEDVIIIGDLNATVTNSIIWGGLDEELLLADSEQGDFSVILENNIIASASENYEPENIISNETNFPGFYAPIVFNFQLDSLSSARDLAPDSDVTTDLLGTIRDEFPDIGAYERKDSIP